MFEKDKKTTDTVFEGLYAASAVTLTPEEKARLRETFDDLADLARRVRRSGRSFERRMQPLWIPPRAPR